MNIEETLKKICKGKTISNITKYNGFIYLYFTNKTKIGLYLLGIERG